LYALDACDDGLGIICGPFAKFWPLPVGWKNLEGLDMGVAEAWAMEALVLAAIGLGERDCVLSVLGDNKGVIYGWLKGRSASEQVNETFVRMVASASMAGIEISPSYVNTHHNPADRVSRGDTSGFHRSPSTCRTPGRWWPASCLPHER
ncbi:unnamed protein product, partial [Tilletia controversa]